MSRTPGSNGRLVGPSHTEAGYDAYFTQLAEPSEATARTWHDTVAGRGGDHGRTSGPATEPGVAHLPGRRAVGDVPESTPSTVESAPGQMVSRDPQPASASAPGDVRTTAPRADTEPVGQHRGPIQAPAVPAYGESTAETLAQAQVAAAAAPATSRAPEVRPPAGAPAPAHGRPGLPAGAAPPDRLPAESGRPEPAEATEYARAQSFPLALTSAELLADIAANRRARLRSTSGMRGALNRVGFNIGLSPAEQRTEDRRGRIRRPLATTHQIAVLNVKGGVGRTTTVATLGSVFAALRPDRVVAIDANPDFGDLTARTGPHPYGLTLRDLAKARDIDAFSAVQSFATINPADLAVLASPWVPTAVEALSGREYLDAVEVLRRHYSLMMIDCGTGVLDSATDAVLRTSDAALVVTPATVRGVTGAVATLQWLNSHGLYRLAAEAVIAIVHQQEGKPVVEVERIEELFAGANHVTRVLPFDEHLAEGGEIDIRMLDRGTVLAFEELAAELADGFPGQVIGEGGGWR